MKNSFRFALAISLSALAIGFMGCGRDKAPANETAPAVSGQQDVPTFPLEGDKSIHEIVANAKLSCEDGVCPENVGLIGFKVSLIKETGKPGIGQCTGFLIEKNVVATNSHCVQELTPSSDCTNWMAIQFPPSAKEATNTYRCKKLLRKSNITKEVNALDYAFFEIEPTKRSPVKTRKSGVRDQLPLRVVKVNPIGKVLGGSIQTVRCSSVQNTILNPVYSTDWADRGLGLGCETRGGNSGSPVFDDTTGEVIAIVFATHDDRSWNSIKGQLRHRVFDIQDKHPANMLFSSLSCIEDPLTGRMENSSLCEAASKAPRPADYFHSAWEKQGEEMVEAKLEAWKESLPRFAKFRFLRSFKDRGMMIANPHCLLPVSQWPAQMKEQVQKAQEARAKTITLETRYEGRISYIARMGLDSQFRFDNEVKTYRSVATQHLRITFESEQKPAKAHIYPLNEKASASSFPEIELNWCSESEV